MICRNAKVMFDLFKFFWNERWAFLGGSVVHWGSYGLKQGSPLQKSKITHSYLIFLFYCHFLLHYLTISRSTELRFDYIDIFYSLGTFSYIEASTACNRGILSNFLKITHSYLIFIFYYHSLLQYLIISRSTELRFDYINIFE